MILNLILLIGCVFYADAEFPVLTQRASDHALCLGFVPVHFGYHSQSR